MIICEILNFPWRPSQAFSSSKSSETVFYMPRGLLSWHGAPLNVPFDEHYKIGKDHVNWGGTQSKGLKFCNPSPEIVTSLNDWNGPNGKQNNKQSIDKSFLFAQVLSRFPLSHEEVVERRKQKSSMGSPDRNKSVSQ